MENKRYCIDQNYVETIWHFSDYDLKIKSWEFIYNDGDIERVTIKIRIEK